MSSFQPGFSLIFLIYLSKAVDSKSFTLEKIVLWYLENSEFVCAVETQFKKKKKVCVPEWPDFSEQIRPKKDGRKEVLSLFIAKEPQHGGKEQFTSWIRSVAGSVHCINPLCQRCLQQGFPLDVIVLGWSSWVFQSYIYGKADALYMYPHVISIWFCLCMLLVSKTDKNLQIHKWKAQKQAKIGGESLGRHSEGEDAATQMCFLIPYPTHNTIF